MFDKKYDLFVTAFKIRDITVNTMVESIVLKLYSSFQQHLKAEGFIDIDVDVHRLVPDIALTDDELVLLNSQPFYLSEHYLGQSFLVEHLPKSSTLFNSPFRCRPGLAEYTYCHGGKRPMFHLMFIGAPNTGKSFLIREFKKVLKLLAPRLTIIECDNGYNEYAPQDFINDHSLEIPDPVKHKKICIGNGPTSRVVAGNHQVSNVNL